MKRFSILTVFLVLTLAACGGAQQSATGPPEQAPPEPQTERQAQTEESSTEETNTEQASAGDSVQEPSQEEEPSGPTATTIDGEEVSLGGRDVTALFFMAGW